MFLILEPNHGAAPFFLGMSRREVRFMLVGDRVLTLPSEIENDQYPDDGLVFGYDSDNRLKYIQVTGPSIASYQDIHFVGSNVQEVLRRLAALGFSQTYDAGSYVFPEINLALQAPADRIVSVTMFKDGFQTDTRSQ